MNKQGQVFLKLYARDLDGVDKDLLVLEIQNGTIQILKGKKPLKENIRKMDKKEG